MPRAELCRTILTPGLLQVAILIIPMKRWPYSGLHESPRHSGIIIIIFIMIQLHPHRRGCVIHSIDFLLLKFILMKAMSMEEDR